MNPSRRLPTTIVLAAVILAGLVVRQAAAATGQVPWSVRTAANRFGADRPNFGYTLNRGGHLEDGIVVGNHGTTPLRLGLYAADAFTNHAGRLDLLTRDGASTGVGGWVQPGRDAVTVPAGKSVAVPFAITVPGDAAPGDHMGGIVTSLRQGNVERRVGIRIRLRVSGALQPGLSVQHLHIRYSGRFNPLGKGKATVAYTIHNTGNAILAARQTVSASGLFGTSAVSAGTFPNAPALLPGETWNVSVPLHGLTPAGRLTATVTLVPLLGDAAGSIAPLAATRASAHAWTIPWALLLAIVALCGLAVAGLAGRSRRRDRAPGQSRLDSAEQAPREREASSRA